MLLDITSIVYRDVIIVYRDVIIVYRDVIIVYRDGDGDGDFYKWA